MLLELLRVALAALFLVIVPGLLVVNATLPRGRSTLSRLERAYLSIATGMMVLWLVGVTLGYVVPHGARGYFQTAATGMPFVEGAMTLVCLAAFAIGLERGAYPSLAARFPRLLPSRWSEHT